MAKIVIGFWFFVIAIIVFLQLCHGKVMMEYIGATGKPVTFDEVPIEPSIDFHFILSFAIDSNPSGTPQNGIFKPYWNPSLTPDSVTAIKSKHPNVKTLASLSGWSLGSTTLGWYNPQKNDVWITNAFTSLRTLIQTYHLDGIDIDYENFPKHNESFSYCIGELITYLKNQSVITVATIAPYRLTTMPYVKLFATYGDVIDYVNYQFYTDKVRTTNAYVNDFTLRVSEFDKAKVLPSYEVDGRGIQGDEFFVALEILVENGFDVNGIMIYSADASASSNSTSKFYYEQKSQEFLLNSSRV